MDQNSADTFSKEIQTSPSIPLSQQSSSSLIFWKKFLFMMVLVLLLVLGLLFIKAKIFTNSLQKKIPKPTESALINTGVKCTTNADCQDLPCSALGFCPIYTCQNSYCYEDDSPGNSITLPVTSNTKTENLKSYSNSQWNLTFKYPITLDIKETIKDDIDPNGKHWPGITIRLTSNKQCEFMVGLGTNCQVFDISLSKYSEYQKKPELNFDAEKIGDFVYYIHKPNQWQTEKSSGVQLYSDLENKTYILIQYRNDGNDSKIYPDLLHVILSTLSIAN